MAIIFVSSFILMPFYEMIQKYDRGEQNYMLSRELKQGYNIHGNIAANDKWGYTLELMYNLKNNFGSEVYYYGMPNKHQGDENILSEFKSNNIDYYIVWDGGGPNLLNYKDITDGRMPDLKIYYIKE